ncbi:MAG: hypothetical protein AAF488_14430, partial [Planctomycetota bacterium]
MRNLAVEWRAVGVILALVLPSTLLADPVLESGLRLGGDQAEGVRSLALDAQGNIYVTGATRSESFSAPAGQSPRSAGERGDLDVFVTKLASDGETVLYTTFFGGRSFDQGLGIGVDDDGNAWVAGSTPATDTGFPTTPGAYRSTPGDFFIARINPQGELVYSSYFGGRNIGSFGGFAVSGAGASVRISLVGTTTPGHPTTERAYRRSLGGAANGFLSVLEPLAEEVLVHSTLFQGEFPSGVAHGPQGRVYLTGATVSATYPVLHAMDSTREGREAFVAVFDPELEGDEALVYSTLLGGGRDENIGATDADIAVDANGVALVTGTTFSLDFPVTPQGFQLALDNSSAFFVAIDPSKPGRDSFLYGTHYGGLGGSQGVGIAAGPPGTAYVLVSSLSADLPTRDGSVAPKLGEGPPGSFGDAILAKFDWTRVGGESLVEASYVGGSGVDFGFAIDARGAEVIIAGRTESTAVFEPAPGPGSEDGFVARVLTTTLLPPGRVGLTESDALPAEFGVGPHSFTTTGGLVPTGLELSVGGSLGGVPEEVGRFVFRVQVEDSLGETRELAFEKRIGPEIGQDDLMIRKASVPQVPGRVLPYQILVHNRSEKTLYNVGVVELLQPWFEWISATPEPSVIEPRPLGNVYWVLPEIGPGEFEVITYNVRLPDQFPLGVLVSGEACLTEADCTDEHEQCEAEARERCDNSTCEQWGSPGPFCTQCETMEGEQCRQEKIRCNKLVGGSSGPLLPGEGNMGGGCNTKSRRTRGPIDPNIKEVTSDPFIRADEVLGYAIYFENIGNAEARDVFLVDVLDEDLDLSTIRVQRRLGGFEYLPLDTEVSIYDDDEEEWNVSLDSATRTLRFELLNIDLLPGVTDNVFFLIAPREGLESGTEIWNESTIQFEVFDILTTNATLNTIDTTAPETVVSPLPETTFSEEFEISWEGFDPVGEIEAWYVYVSVNDAPFELLVAALEEGNTIYQGEFGSTYAFACAAVDTVGNVEVFDGPEAVTTLARPKRQGFHRADPNGSGASDISDAVTIFSRDVPQN